MYLNTDYALCIQIGCSHNYTITRCTALLAILPIVWSTSLIRDLKYIVPLSSLANVSICASIILILYSTVFDLPPIEEQQLFQPWKYLPLSFGCIVFAVEGITMVKSLQFLHPRFRISPFDWLTPRFYSQTLPLQQSMKEKHQFSTSFGVLNISIAVLAFTLWTLGFFGYWKFGDNVETTLTKNLNIANNAYVNTPIIIQYIGMIITKVYTGFRSIFSQIRAGCDYLSNDWNFIDVYITILRRRLYNITIHAKLLSQ